MFILLLKWAVELRDGHVAWHQAGVMKLLSFCYYERMYTLFFSMQRF